VRVRARACAQTHIYYFKYLVFYLCLLLDVYFYFDYFFFVGKYFYV